MIWSIFRVYWRPLLPVLVVLVFVGLLTIAGFAFLINQGWLLWFLGLVAASAFAVWLIQMSPSFKRPLPTDEIPPPVIAWSPLEEGAMGEVRKLAEKAAKSPPRDLDEVRGLGESLVRTVAGHLHPGREFATAHFTVPDLLVALEEGVRDLRTKVIEKVPGSDVIKVSDLQLVLKYYRQYGSMVKALYFAYRAFRIITNPAQAVIQEASGLLQGETLNSGWKQVNGALWRVLIEEGGRLCIDLYGGRLKAQPGELERQWRRSLPPSATPLPVRVLVVGQVNAGKSSLVNALLGDTQCEVSVVPTTTRVSEFRVCPKDGPDILVVDTPGLDDSTISVEVLKKHAAESDIVLWAVAASNPARDIDRRALQALESYFTANPKLIRPPILGAATQIDRLPPRREWSPPYNLDFPDSDKADSIRNALTHVRNDLAPHVDVLVPICLKSEGGSAKPYNIEAVWVALALMVPDGRRAALRRMLDNRPGFSLSKAVWQVWQSGRFVGKSLLEVRLDQLHNDA